MWRNAGIVGAGAYIPDFRIGMGALASVWSLPSNEADEKSVANEDEDATTMAVEAAMAAVTDAGIDADEIDAVWVGTESKPYAVGPVSATVAEAIGATPWVQAADLEFACRGAIEGLLALAASIESGNVRNALVVAADVAQGRPGDELERTAGAGAAAFVLGPAERSTAILSDSVSYITDTPDFFRRDGAAFPTHAHRFTGQPAYFEHVTQATRMFFEQTFTGARDFRFVVFHQPTSKFPSRAAHLLGFSSQQVDPLMLVNQIGNPYAANSFLGLVRALDLLKPGDQVLVTCYGSGAGADCFAVKATPSFQPHKRRIDRLVRRTLLLEHYHQYLKMTRQIGEVAS